MNQNETNQGNPLNQSGQQNQTGQPNHPGQPHQSSRTFSCTDCGKTGCRRPGEDYPSFCPTASADQQELNEVAALYASDTIDGKIARASAKIEGNYYCQKTRVEETVLFIKEIGAKKVGIATCAGLIEEAKLFSKILQKNGIEHVGIICKVGSRDKTEMGLPDADKIRPGSFEPMCNPVMQARVLNRAHTDLNIVIGLCVGHDALFNKYSEAPVTTLIAKDRVLAHNPAGALYCQYYQKKF